MYYVSLGSAVKTVDYYRYPLGYKLKQRTGSIPGDRIFIFFFTEATINV